MGIFKKKKRPGATPKAWENYEDVARYVLEQLSEHFGLREVEGKQVLPGASGTDWEIDGVAYRDTDDAALIVECRLYKRRLSQEAVGAVAYRIRDIDADGGFTVSPLPLQRGAKIVADYENIQHIQLDPASTRERWLAKIGDVLKAGLKLQAETKPEGSLGMVVTRADGSTEERKA
jgi:hypothetical protein